MIPQTSARPKSWRTVPPAGIDGTPALSAIHDASRIPTVLPTSIPSSTPHRTGLASAAPALFYWTTWGCSVRCVHQTGDSEMEKTEFTATAAALSAAAANPNLSEREKHLIGLAVTATRGCIHCTGGRIQKALDGGVSREALVAAVDLAAAVNAGVTIRTALTAVEHAEASAACASEACVGASALPR